MALRSTLLLSALLILVAACGTDTEGSPDTTSPAGDTTATDTVAAADTLAETAGDAQVGPETSPEDTTLPDDTAADLAGDTVPPEDTAEVSGDTTDEVLDTTEEVADTVLPSDTAEPDAADTVTTGCQSDDDCQDLLGVGPCSPGVCNDDGTCSLAPFDDGTACDDDDPCTVDGVCQGGDCVVEALCEAPLVCDGGACVDGYEEDDTAQEAPTIATDEVQTHTAAPVGDQDWIAFVVPEESLVTVTIMGGVDALSVTLLDGKLQPRDDVTVTPLGGGATYTRLAQEGIGFVRVVHEATGSPLDDEAYTVAVALEPYVCVPSCDGATCGDDGCGGSCGTCEAPQVCEAGACVAPTVPGSWTCEASTYAAGDGCHCGCGAWDPDCVAGATIVGCADGEACVPEGECAAVASWAFLVYLNADNSLSEDGTIDLDEMKAVGSNTDVEIVVLFDDMDGPAELIRVTAGGTEVIEAKGEIDMGDPDTLAEFALWGVTHVPADKHALVMWNHGEGWRGPKEEATGMYKSFSNDDTDGGEISIAKGDLAGALAPAVAAKGGPFELIGFDACLMGMWEVAMATAPFADVLVVSQELEPATGWAFDDLLTGLQADPTMDASALGTIIADTYHDTDTEASTCAVIDLTAMEDLALAVTALGDALAASPEIFSKVESVRSNSMGFDLDTWGPWGDDDTAYRDLYDFAERMATVTEATPAIIDASALVMAAIDAAVLHTAVQYDYADAHGLSIHFPAQDVCLESNYANGAGAVWSVQTTWDDFLSAFAGGTCEGWSCDPSYYDANDGCDCGCGAWDPDCDDDSEVYGCPDGSWCMKPGLCVGAPAACQGWSCGMDEYDDGVACTCGCGCLDPDCNDDTLPITGCDEGLTCGFAGTCADPANPQIWACDDEYYDADDGCDCECGAWDPDCDDPYADVYGCEGWGAQCVYPGVCS